MSLQLGNYELQGEDGHLTSNIVTRQVSTVMYIIISLSMVVRLIVGIDQETMASEKHPTTAL